MTMEAVKIVAVDAIPVRYRLKGKPPVGGYGVWPDAFVNVIVKLHTSAGATGVGEGPAETFYLGETPEHVLAGVRRLGAFLEGKDLWMWRRWERTIDREVLGYHGSMSAKFALSTAIYDAMARIRDEPFSNVLGGCVTSPLPLLAHVFNADEAATVDMAAAFAELGYSGVEVKCTATQGSAHKAAARLASVAKQVPSHVLVVGDANQSWASEEETLRAVALLRERGNAAIEQPLHYLNLPAMARVAERSPVPIIADEAVFSPQSMALVAQMGAAHVVNLKLPRIGSLDKAMQIAAIAKGSGLSVRLDYLHYGKIGDTVAANVASCIDGNWPVAVDCHELYEADDVAEGGVQIDHSTATASLPDAPGLGITLDDAQVESMRVNL